MIYQVLKSTQSQNTDPFKASQSVAVEAVCTIIKQILHQILELSWATNIIITYEEKHNKGDIYCMISHVCHNKIVCPLGSFVAYDWLP